jgi:hypothetical protein
MVRATVSLFLVVCGLATIAFAGSDKTIDSVKSLAGDWGSIDRSPARIQISEDGTYEGTAATGASTAGRITMTDGKASFQSTSAGTVTLSEENGKAVLTFTRSDGRGSARLQWWKR